MWRKNIFNNIIVSGAFVFAIVSTLLGIYTMTQLSEVSETSFEIKEASDIAILALDFNVENYHTQLEVWEYAYEPNERRLDAFKEHDDNLTALLDELVEKVEEEAEDHMNDSEEIRALVLDGEIQIRATVVDLDKVRTDWVGIFERAGELQSFKESGIEEGSPEYEEVERKLLIEVSENEDLFDGLEFNKEIDRFVEDQKALVSELHSKQKKLIDNFSLLFFLLVIVFVLFNVFIAIFLVRTFGRKNNEQGQILLRNDDAS